jgi:hypothetical protein
MVKPYIVYIPTFSNDIPLVEYFRFLYRDKIKFVNEVRLAHYILTPYPTQVLTFNANLDAKKMYIEEFFINELPKELTTAQEKENIFGMVGSKDEGSYKLADKLLMTADIWNDRQYLLRLSDAFNRRLNMSSTLRPLSDECVLLKKVFNYANCAPQVYNK